MLKDILLPQLGQTMEEGTVERWHKAEGDRIERGDALYELTTDKATLEVEAFVAGVLLKILAGEGQTVPVNDLVAIVGEEGDELPEDIEAYRARVAGAASSRTATAEVQETEEAPVTEAAPGRLLMMMRTGMGRLYQAWSHDDGETWTRPLPTSLASSTAPG
ncbi:MAG: biotin/lipoyl-containing protein, partial [Candidatus Brocadiia bacterium]|nr:biotin/lipoyl-containing protein [Candidatus Brocadiia bacterium]